jgi:Fe-S-cluster-containing dehydrogenase component/formate-dependent nitrite reductase membrane component NrfD
VTRPALPPVIDEGTLVPRWGKVVDQTTCIGCHACTTACRSENAVPLGVTRTYVKAVEVGAFPEVRRSFQVTRCNQCDDAPCVAICPTSAMHRRPDGIVDFDKASCIGCKACMAACPYDAIFINPDDHGAEKCNLCAHRLDVGLEPACVTVCPVGAIIVGDLDDPTSRIAGVVAETPVAVRRPEKGTRPKLFYRGATRATLDPLAARRPDGGLYMWSEQGPGVRSGHPDHGGSSAAALLAYDVVHRAPWDWRVSLYTWTKGISSGAYLVAVLLALLGQLDWSGAIVRRDAPLVALALLALTGAILVADLEHPARAHYLLLRPQWRSWLVRGAVVLAGFGAALALHLAGAARVTAPFGVPLGVLTAVYTGFLFRQARGRDLWQSPLLAPHLLVQAIVAGAAALLPLAAAHGSGVRPLAVTLAVASAAHLALVAAELLAPHGTGHAALATFELARGRYAWPFLAGLLLVAVALAAPWIDAWAAPAALLGLLAYEHAHVQAAQAVPLA